MSVKAILVLCAHALFIQTVFGQCIGRGIDASGFGVPYGLAGPALAGPVLANNGLAPGLAYDGINWAGRGLPCGSISPAMEFTATSGGSLPVTSTSAIAPTGISVISENVFEGALSVAGELPFVGTTGMEGSMASAGAGAVSHACGDGHTAMVSEAVLAPAAGIAPAVGIAPTAGISPAAVSPISGFAGFAPGFATGLGYGPANRLGLGGCGRSALY